MKNIRCLTPSVVIEPTCGVGNFLKSSFIFDSEEYYGIEIDPYYCEVCRSSIDNRHVSIINADFFNFSFEDLIKKNQKTLILGNPPWVTNSELSVLYSSNVPEKKNFKQLKGLEAITGASNFDICEYIILQLIHQFINTDTTIAMLCKISVARNIFKELKRNDIAFVSCDILEFDASKIFNVSVSACLLVVQLSCQPNSTDVCTVYDFDEPGKIKSQFGYSNNRFYSAIKYGADDFDGLCCFEWRQGIKHDCSKIMELTLNEDGFENGLKECVEIEAGIVFPLVKSSMFKKPIIHDFSRFVIVTQRKSREDTQYIAYDFPKAWEYLNCKMKIFNSRKSSIYRNAPLFSMFGVGAYSYAKYKVGISGFYKKPLFSILYSDSQPVMVDDTAYFICFDEYNMAYTAMLLLNSERVQAFLMSLVFLDAKRPYTKKVLARIDFNKIVRCLTVDELKITEKKLNLPCYIDSLMYEAFKSKLHTT